MPKRHPVDFFSEGVRLKGDIFVPDQLPPGERFPGVVLCHGYTGVKELYLPEHAARFADAGYIALIFDYKGWGASDAFPAPPSEANLTDAQTASITRGAAHYRNRLAPHSRVADVQAAVTILAEHTSVDPDRIALYGTSYGGAICTYTAGIDPRVSCLVTLVGVGNGARWMRSVRTEQEWTEAIDEMRRDRSERARTGVSAFRDRYDIMYADPESVALAASARDQALAAGAVNEIPLSYIDETLEFNADLVLDKISPRPAMFITSDNDLLVPPAESVALYEAYSGPKELVMLKGYSHYAVYLEPALSEVMERVLPWFDRWLQKP